MAQFYTAARQYGGRDDESLARARTTFFKTCDAFAVPPKLRANCVQFSVKQTEHNVPALIHDPDGFSADNIWDAIANRVTSTARDLRISKLWQIASLATEPHIAGDTEVTRFERLIGRLVTLQSQMPSRYQTAPLLTDKIMETITDQWFAATVIPDSAGDPHVLAARIKLMLTTGPPSTEPTTPSMSTTSPALTDPTPPTSTYITDHADSTEHAATDTMTVTMAADDPDEPNRVFYVLKRFRANSTTPYRTDRPTAHPHRSYRGPGPNNPCYNCQGTDHFARECPALQGSQTRAPQSVRLSDAIAPPTGDAYSSPPMIEPPPIPRQGPGLDHTSHIYYQASTWTVSEPDATTAILDIGSPGDIVGDKWLAANPQHVTTPMTPATDRWAMGRDVPETIGYISIRITTTTKAGDALSFDLPRVYVLRHDTVPLLTGLPSYERLDLVVRAKTKTCTVGDAKAPVLCTVARGHLTLLPAPKPRPPTTASSIY
eukprot:contig_3563_g772